MTWRSSAVDRPDCRAARIGFVRVDEHRQTSIAGMYAAGDMTGGCLDVLSAAYGGAAIAKRMTTLLAQEPASSTPLTGSGRVPDGGGARR